MKKIAFYFLIAASAFAQAIPIGITKISGTNVIANGPVVIGTSNSLTVASGGSLILASGSTFTPQPGTLGAVQNPPCGTLTATTLTLPTP